MKLNNRLLLIALVAITVATVAASGQCPRSDLTPKWNTDKGQFTCISRVDSKETASEQAVLPTGDKKYCSSARDNLLKVCPSGDEGKSCRGEAKAVFNSCYKTAKESPPDGQSNRGNKTDSTVCMSNFSQQQQACASRKTTPSSPGQPAIPDTCLQDALAAQNKCLANSH